MNADTIDILLPTYNGEKYLKEQIDSILNQTYKNIRLIISDDCSKDSTPKILEEYREKDERIELYLQKENIGVVKGIEFLLKKVKSNYYMLADQDDVWLPMKVEKSIETGGKKRTGRMGERSDFRAICVWDNTTTYLYSVPVKERGSHLYFKT